MGDKSPTTTRKQLHFKSGCPEDVAKEGRCQRFSDKTSGRFWNNELMIEADQLRRRQFPLQVKSSLRIFRLWVGSTAVEMSGSLLLEGFKDARFK